MPSTLGIVASGSWSPLELSPALWLDAADTSTITESGGSVSQWDDKSGSGRNAQQASASNQPTTGSATQNGLNVLAFDGNDYLVGTCGIVGNTSWSMFVVSQVTGSSTEVPLFAGTRSANSGTGVGYNAAGFYNAFIWSGAESQTAGSITLGSHVALTSVREVGGTLTLFYNGTGQSPIGASSTNIQNVLNIGRANGVFPIDGEIAEIIIFDYAVSAQQRATVDDYLRSKWSIY